MSPFSPESTSSSASGSSSADPAASRGAAGSSGPAGPSGPAGGAGSAGSSGAAGGGGRFSWLSRRRKLWGGILIGALVVAGVAGSTLGWFLTFDIPEVKSLQDWKPPVVTTLYSADGKPLYQFGAEKRIVVDLDAVPQAFLDGLVATEDAHFYDHVGVDPWGIARAIIKDVIHMRKAQGGSTLTQQLARSLFLKPEKTWRRKLQEMVLALQIEKSFTKSEILNFYVNQVYMGHGRYGIEAAARFYFGKPAKELTLPESALLAGLVQRPEAYSPIRAPERATNRRNVVLRRMVEEKKVDRETATAAIKSPVVVAKVQDEDNIAPYFVEEVRRYLDATYGEVALYQEGLEVYTTLDPALQRAANQAVFDGLRALDKRRGWRGVPRNLIKEKEDPARFTHASWMRPPMVGRQRWGVITEVGKKDASVRLGEWTAHLDAAGVKWTNKSIEKLLKVGDLAPFLVQKIDEGKKTLTVALDQEPDAESALLVLDPSNGEVRALVGGWDFNRSQFDRATQSYRQAGSAFKPFVYAAALESGYTLAQTIFDEPTVFVDQATGDQYQPNNYYRKYYGVTTLREAMEESRNIVAVKLLNEVGYGRTIDTARRMGISSALRPYPSMALGTMEVSLWDLVTAYSVFANQGVRVEPHFIRQVVDREGRVREEAKPRVVEAIRADVAYLMTYLLEGVTEAGTGAAAASALDRVVAGKTGTTDDLADAWFVGFSPSLIAGAWVGFDQKKTLGEGETGAKAALPIWIEFMQAAHQGKPVEKFSKPANIAYTPIDRRLGKLATSDSHCPAPFLEAFIEGTEPTEACSEAEHFRASLPYYLQKFEISRDLELRIEPEVVARLVREGSGDLELAPDGKELILKGDDGSERRLRLDLSRGERKDLQAGLQVLQPIDAQQGATGGEVPVGIDGRPATIVPIKPD
ncbi:MAG TPA: PBP1A family penicillin-binding protein [Candidatus Polarisedimenticolia bacterium]|nr:PBP1A family penicillin-binding protein [Candidatus Polarisedimenticolia bacterium]